MKFLFVLFLGLFAIAGLASITVDWIKDQIKNNPVLVI